MFHVTLNPSAELELQLLFRPQNPGQQDIELEVNTLSNGAGAIAPVRRAVSVEGVQPQIIISKTMLVREEL
jgi:hypothetical protein